MLSFFDPGSVVLIGVPRKSGPGALNNFEMMLRYGYKGRVYLVHPKVDEILGHKTYPKVADLPEVPDLAVISVGRDRVLPVFSECAAKGIRCVIVISQGFADADERGRELQQEIAGIARQSGVRVVGPNTMGSLDAFSGFSTAFIDIERDPEPPPLSMVVQSGVFQVAYESFSTRLGKAIDIGNACDIDFVDVLEYLENDPRTRIIVLHMEGMKRGREFLRVAARVARQKPIIVLKTGRSVAGARAALSHTGSLVGEDAIFDAAFEKAGLIRVRNMIEMRAVCNAFLHFRSVRGPRLAVLTATGACGIITADACEDYGLELAPRPGKIDELENPRIAWHKLGNPVDLWPLGMVSGSFTDVFLEAGRRLLADEGVDALLGIAPTIASPLHADIQMIETIGELNKSNAGHKPIALWLYGGDENTQCARLDEPDVACFATIDEAVMGLAAIWRYQRFQLEGEPRSDAFAPLPAYSAKQPAGRSLLVGEEAFSLLAQYAIPLVPGRLACDIESAVSNASKFGYPVVLKIISPEWLHKSDRGGIRLGIESEAGLRGAWAELTTLFGRQTPEGTLEGILVQKQVRGTELLFGIKKDPEFGPVLVAGMGGIYTEVMRDVARAVAPVNRAEAEGMLRSLRIWPILEGTRGQKGADVHGLVEILLSLSRLAMDNPGIEELDLNPVLATSEGCWCVDCRIVNTQT